jgi:outer membrane protein TolC
VLRAQVQLQNQRLRTIGAENELEKTKLQLARAIGLPSGQTFTLTDRIPYAPLARMYRSIDAEDSVREPRRLPRARVSGSPPPRRHTAPRRGSPADRSHGRRLRALGQSPSDSHPTYRVAATLRIPIFDAGRSTGGVWNPKPN